MKPKKVLLVVGARPNFMKAAPILHEFNNNSNFSSVLVHTGQHYDYEMSSSFFNELNLSRPDIYLGVGSGTHAEQTGRIMIEFEKVCLKEKPNLVIVVGDVNSTVACALVASKFLIPVAHVEAGLRSFDRTMPEEINRLLTDQLSDFLFTTCEDANQNLIREGIPEDKIYFVGNVMIDTLMQHIKLAKNSKILENLGLKHDHNTKKYALLTLHRPSNVDNPSILNGIFEALLSLSKTIPIIFPVHPRTLKQIKKFKLNRMINYVKDLSLRNVNMQEQKLLALPSLGYLDFLRLMSKASLVLTDSGGIQEETTILGVPCLTLRNNTERPITVKEGTNIVVGNSPDKILSASIAVLENKIIKKRRPKYWDGKAAKRIVNILTKYFGCNERNLIKLQRN